MLEHLRVVEVAGFGTAMCGEILGADVVARLDRLIAEACCGAAN